MASMGGVRARGVPQLCWWLVALGLCLGLPGASQAQGSSADQTALLALSNALTPIIRTTNQPLLRWWTLARWTNHTLPCNASQPRWKFISCDATGRVTEVHLNATATPSVRLKGTIPWALLGPMDMLQTLVIQKQEVQGEAFPENMPVFGNLLYLDLSFNNLTSLTEQVSQLAALTYLSLSHNPNMAGTIPANVSALADLVFLSLNTTKLTGPFPDHGSVNLTSLDLGHNELSGTLPDVYSALTALTLLDVSGNNATGTIPDPWSSLTLLERLEASANSLLGEFPSAVSGMTALTYLSLRENKFYNAVPDAIWTSTIPRIDLRLNFFNGTPPASFNASAILVGQNCLTVTSPPLSEVQRSTSNCTNFYNSIASLESPPPPAPPPPPSGGSSTNTGLIIGLCVAGGVLLLALIGLIIWFFLSRRSNDDEYDEDDEEDHDERGDDDEEEEEEDDDDKDRR